MDGTLVAHVGANEEVGANVEEVGNGAAPESAVPNGDGPTASEAVGATTEGLPAKVEVPASD